MLSLLLTFLTYITMPFRFILFFVMMIISIHVLQPLKNESNIICGILWFAKIFMYLLSFNIKCFPTDCSFETFNDNNVPNILQYDIYMSSNPIIQTTYPQIPTPKPNLNMCAIGTPENYNLDRILPSYITLLRYDIDSLSFNYLSLVSPNSNLTVSFNLSSLS